MTETHTSYGYIDLTETKYKPILDYEILPKDTDPAPLLEIYRQYCMYKKFASAWPIYAEEFAVPQNDVLAYRDGGEIVAWTLIYRVSHNTVWNMQFAWNYANPKLRLGYKSLRTECAIYRELGYEKMTIDEDMIYKSQIQGYKLFGPMT